MWIWLCTGLVILPPAVEVETLAGQVTTGAIVELTQRHVVVDTTDGRVELELAALKELRVRASQPAQLSPAVEVQLADGSTLVASDYAVADGRASIALAAGGQVEVPAGDVAWVRLQPCGAVGSQWSKLVTSPQSTDLLVTRKGEVLDYHGGIISDVGQATVGFEMEGEVLPVRRRKVFGLIYYQAAGRPMPETICRLTLADGSRWAVRRLAGDADGLRWTSPLGVERRADWANVYQLDFSGDKIVYLSDLEPQSVRWTPFFEMGQQREAVAKLFGLRRDRSLDGGPLQLAGRAYTKGLALHSRSEVTYRLPSGFRRFRAVVGIDDAVRPYGHVLLVIRGDGAVLFERAVTGVDPPLPVELDIQGVRRLTITVDFGQQLDVADHLDVCEARVVK